MEDFPWSKLVEMRGGCPVRFAFGIYVGIIKLSVWHYKWTSVSPPKFKQVVTNRRWPSLALLVYVERGYFAHVVLTCQFGGRSCSIHWQVSL